MTFQTNVSIKEEPLTPPFTTGQQQMYSFPEADTTSTMSTTSFTSGSAAPTKFEPSQTDLPQTVVKREVEEDIKPETRMTLKDAILSRRKARGDSDIPVLFEQPKQFELTQADLDRREKRKEQNRRAAKRCRNKKKMFQEGWKEQSARIEKENESMQIEILQLRKEVNTLQGVLDDHVNSGWCQVPLTPTQQAVLSHLATRSIPQQYTQHHATKDPTKIHGLHSDCKEAVHEQMTVTESNQTETTSISNPFQTVKTNMSPKNINLPSWDLSNIVPDLPADTVMDAFRDLAPMVENEESPNEKTHQVTLALTDPEFPVPKPVIKPAHVKNLNLAFSQIERESTTGNVTDPFSSQDNSVNLYTPSVHQTHLIRDNSYATGPPIFGLNEPTATHTPYYNRSFREDLNSPVFPCVSPNLVQQFDAPSQQHSTDHNHLNTLNLASCNGSHPNTISPFTEESFINVLGDNRASCAHATPARPGIQNMENAQVHHVYPQLVNQGGACHLQTDHHHLQPSPSYHVVPTFEFPSCPDPMYAHGNEPISPFLTTGAGARGEFNY